jgi:CRISPR system Cascade subunit CasC
MLIELHIIQNFAPSNLNRDDTNSPKDAEFGGVRRARISSQCLKRAIRLAPVFAETTRVAPAVRTRWITRLLAEDLVKDGKPAEQAALVAEAFAAQYAKLAKDEKSKENRSGVLLYLSATEIAAIRQSLKQDWEAILAALPGGKIPQIEAQAKALFNSLKGRTSAPDIALFGRMVAEKPELNIDAACQVAHALSTHQVSMEMDFYTAVDDLALDEETGAGMMGILSFNSACFYRYACLDLEQLVNNLGGNRELALRTVEAFLRAAAVATPSGKQNSSAAQNPPSFLLAVVRADHAAWSLANAFEKPVRPGREAGLVERSIQALDAYWGRLTQVYGANGRQPFALLLDGDLRLPVLGPAVQPTFETWVSAVKAALG